MIYNTHYKNDDVQKDFKASLGWIRNWRRRFNIVYRAKTHSQTLISSDHGEKINSFIKELSELIEKNKYNPRVIVNMDETPVYYDLPSKWTLERKVIWVIFYKLLNFIRVQRR